MKPDAGLRSDSVYGRERVTLVKRHLLRLGSGEGPTRKWQTNGGKRIEGGKMFGVRMDLMRPATRVGNEDGARSTTAKYAEYAEATFLV
jgi:hypothetical protein